MRKTGLEDYFNNWKEKKQIVTVFMLTYRRPFYLMQAISSVLAQTYGNFYLIILDNMSKDETSNMVEIIDDERVIYHEHDGNMTGSNFLYAFELVKTKYVIVLHDDDLIEPTYLEEVLKQIDENENLAALSVVNNVISSEGNLVRKGLRFDGIAKFSGDAYFLSYFIYQTQKQSMIYPAAIYNRELLGDIKKYINMEAGPCGDQFMWFEMERQGLSIGIYGAPLFNYRIHKNQDSAIHAGAMRLVLLNLLLKIDHYRELIDQNLDYLSIHIRNAFVAALTNYSEGLYKYKDFQKVYKLIPNELRQNKACRPWIDIYRVSLAFPHFVLIMFKILKKGKRIGKRQTRNHQ